MGKTSSDTAPARLVQGSIGGHLVRQTLPAIVGVAAIMSVGIVDAYFVGRLGSAELAAISFVFPVITALQSLGVGVMVGVNSVVARALGEGDTRQALARANLGVLMGLAAGLVLGLALYLLRGPLFAALQAGPTLLPLIDEYMAPFALGFPLMMAMMGLNGVLRGQGAARSNTVVLVVFAVANWVLDPLLIEGGLGLPALGIAGAAWATVGGWVLALLAAGWLVTRHDLRFAPQTVRDCDWRHETRAIGRVAGPAAFTNAINPAGLAVLTALLAAEGQAAVAGFGAGGRLQAFAVVPLLALSGSIGAIVGQNWGAGQHDRARTALVQAGWFALAYGVAAAVVLFVFREPLVSLFGGDPAMVAEAAHYMAISVWGYAGYGVLILVNGALNAVDRAGQALALSLTRVMLVMIPLAWLARATYGTTAIYAAETAANMAGGLAAAGIAWWTMWRRDRRAA